MSDTIFALSSGQPPAAVAVIRTSGPGALAAAGVLAGTLPPPRRAALRQVRDPASGTVLDQVLILRFDGPASATGEDVVEYQCHGGRAVVQSILDALARQPGMRAAEPGEFTRRAFANGRIDLTEAEGLADLLEAETERQRRAALLRADGGALGRESKALALELGQWLDRPRAEPLREGIRIVAAGPPNAGKSSLINALSQSERAIVTAVAGTTRDVIEVPLAIAGVPFILVDTAGLRDGGDAVERIGIERAQAEVARADILLWLGEPAAAPIHPQLVQLHPRADEPGRGRVPDGLLAVSSVTGSGLDGLIRLLVERAGAILPGDDMVALNQRQATEIAAASAALQSAGEGDLVIMADGLRRAREAIDRITGRAGIDDMLDALFGRFCLGK